MIVQECWTGFICWIRFNLAFRSTPVVETCLPKQLAHHTWTASLPVKSDIQRSINEKKKGKTAITCRVVNVHFFFLLLFIKFATGASLDHGSFQIPLYSTPEATIFASVAFGVPVHGVIVSYGGDGP